METRDFNFKIKSVDEAAGTFTGLASTYGEPADELGDIIAPGAFGQAIARQGAGYPLLMAHRQDAVLGIARIEDSAAGLVAHATLDMTDPAAQSAFNKIKMKALRGLSIGFLPAPGKTQHTDSGRILKEIRLYEISLTPVPANRGAQVFSVKNLGDARLLVQRLDSATLEDGAIEELKAMAGEIKRLLIAAEPDPDEPARAAVARELAGLLAEVKTIGARLPVSA